MKTYILTGGKSSRFGSDKLLADAGGKPVLQRMLDVLLPVSRDLVLCGNPALQSRFDHKVLPDTTTLNGPLNGIFSCLTDRYDGSRFLIAGDMPGITSAGLSWYLDAAGSKPDGLVLPVTPDGKKHFLHLLIPPGLAGPAVSALEPPVPQSVFQWLSRLPVQEIQVPHEVAGHFKNVNFRSDLSHD